MSRAREPHSRSTCRGWTKQKPGSTAGKRRNRRVTESLAVGLMDPAAIVLQVTVEPVPGHVEKRVVTRKGVEVKLSAMELKLLEFLLAREGAVLPPTRRAVPRVASMPARTALSAPGNMQEQFSPTPIYRDTDVWPLAKIRSKTPKILN